MSDQKTIHIALVNAIAELQNVSGNKLNPHYKSKYVTLDALLDSIKPTLHKHGLALMQILTSEVGFIGVETQFIHISGEVRNCGRLCVNSSNLDAQKVGGALTYLRRQSLQAACGISIDLDDDGNMLAQPAKTPAPFVRK